MACRPLIVDGVAVGIACGIREKRCKVAGCGRVCTKLCDYPTPGGKQSTCSMQLCDAHATSARPELDHCPVHSKMEGAQMPFRTASDDWNEVAEAARNPPRDDPKAEVGDFSRSGRVPRAKCRTCQAPICWAKWATSGKNVPIDVTASPKGNIFLRRSGESIVAHYVNTSNEQPKPGEKLFLSHFATCKFAAHHRRGR